MHKFNLDGTDVVAFYHYQSNSYQYKAIYAKVSELVTDPLNAFKTGSSTNLFNNYMTHCDFCHYDNDLNAVFVSPLQQVPFSGTENYLIYGYAPTYHKQTVKTALGL